MRNVALVALTLIISIASTAYGGSSKTEKEMTQFANEVASRIVYRSDASIRVTARDCSLRIEYGAIGAVFETPLKGTTLAATYMEDGIVLQNKAMLRTIKGREPEPFEQLILRFDRNDVKAMAQAFDRAIAFCEGSKMAAAY